MGGPRRLGILGGTFDPVHVGHLVAAVNARYELDLDLVLLVVANEPWQKVAARPVTAAADRLAMVEAAVEGVEGLEASGMEIERGGPSYTADTVAELQDSWPGAELNLIVGADAAVGLSSWERLEEVRSKVVLVVVNRPGTTIADAENDRGTLGLGPAHGRGAGARDIEHRPARPSRRRTTLRLPHPDACHPCHPRTRSVSCGQMSRPVTLPSGPVRAPGRLRAVGGSFDQRAPRSR